MLRVAKKKRSSFWGVFNNQGDLVLCIRKVAPNVCEIRDCLGLDRPVRGRLLVTFVGPDSLNEARQWVHEYHLIEELDDPRSPRFRSNSARVLSQAVEKERRSGSL